MKRGLASAALFIVIALVGYTILLRLEVYMEEVFGSFVTVKYIRTELLGFFTVCSREVFNRRSYIFGNAL